MSGRPVIVLSIGDELLDGRIVDTNAPYLAGELLRLGYRVSAMHTVGDEPGELRALLERLRAEGQAYAKAAGEAEGALVVSSGGLGPTPDDRVRADAAALLGVPLEPVEGAEEPLRALWARHHEEPPPEAFLAQVRVPRGTAPLANPAGAAWGFLLEDDGLRWAALPGPPRECSSAWMEGGACRLLTRAGGAACALGVLHTCGLPESRIEALVRDRFERSAQVRVGITARPEGVSLSVLAAGIDDSEATRGLEEELQLLRERLGEWCWGRDGDSLAAVVVAELARRGQSVSVAESCTGGLLAGALTTVPGSSAVFQRGWVTYADEAKEQELEVPAALLGRHGAVSEEVAVAMAEGARRRAGSDWALSVTGIAGPEGGSEEKPVGTVCFGWAGPEGSGARTRRQFARAGREAVRGQSVRDALDLLRRLLLGLPPLRATGPRP